MMPGLRQILGYALVAPLVVVGTVASTGTPARLTDTAQQQPIVSGTVVGRGSVQALVSARGEIEADDQVSASLLASGQVERLFVDEGDYVLAGTPLLEIDAHRALLAVEQRRLSVQLAQLQLEDLLEVDPDEVEQAEAELAAAQAHYTDVASRVSPEDLAAAEMRYQQAYDAWVAANEARLNAGGDANYIAQLDAAIGEASFNLEIARLRLADLRGSNQADLGAAGAQIAQERVELDQVLAGPTEYQIEQARIAIETAEIALADAERSYGRSVLVAPIDGTVYSVRAEVGEYVSAGVPLVELVDLDPLNVFVDVDEIDIRLVAPDQPVIVRFDALPQLTLTGRVIRIASTGVEINGVIKYEVEVALDLVDARLRHGMSAEASIVVDEVTDVIVVPNRVLRFDGAQANVTVLDADGREVVRPVELGLRGENVTEIVAGLTAGEVLTP